MLVPGQSFAGEIDDEAALGKQAQGCSLAMHARSRASVAHRAKSGSLVTRSSCLSSKSAAKPGARGLLLDLVLHWQKRTT